MFQPQLQILPMAQQLLWSSLAVLRPAGFVLYGGTAIALRYGHRISVDFDFFSSMPLDRSALCRTLPWLIEAEVLQDQPETLTVLSPASNNQPPVKVSWFGSLTIGRVSDPDLSSDGVALVASPLDLLATKLKVVLQRAEKKDYADVAQLLQAGLRLDDGLSAARALFGPGFPVNECLKALVYFADGDVDELPPTTRQQLELAVLGLQTIPEPPSKIPNLSPDSAEG